MDAVKGWAAALCAVAIGCTLLPVSYTHLTPPFFSFVLMEYTSGDFTKARQYRWGSSLRPTR